ncbi:Baseplate assembly protein V (GpV) [Escherichia coli]|uniref:Baseplate assembly protein V (GpV) n=14 Tax=Enterobacterales TaxID=91347 RepID=A0A376WR96_ECOLX|nr:Baseplate assembly protein V (GpV) [Escherichia coli]
MNTLANIQELARALRNMIRTGLVVETDLNAGRCRVQTGGMCTDWLQWLTHRAGRSRTWWAPSVGEQVLILAVGGELDTAFVLPGIYSGDNPAPSASADALHIRFPDGAVIEYEPETSALTVSGVKTASVTASDSVTATVPVVMVKASTRITLDTPEVVCTNRLITGTLEVQKVGRCAATLNTPAVNSHQTVRYCIPINTPATAAAQQGVLYDSTLSRNESQ